MKLKEEGRKKEGENQVNQKKIQKKNKKKKIIIKKVHNKNKKKLNMKKLISSFQKTFLFIINQPLLKMKLLKRKKINKNKIKEKIFIMNMNMKLAQWRQIPVVILNQNMTNILKIDSLKAETALIIY